MSPEQALRKRLLAKGAEVAARLEAILDHKDVDLGDLPAPVDPAADPELRLRHFLSSIDRAIKAFDTPAFGRCLQCGAAIDPAALEEQPWLAGCPLHPVQ